MSRWGTVALGGVVVAVVLSFQLVHWPRAQEVQETEGAPETKVSEAEFDLFISVYTAMQADHDLSIESALTSHGASIDQFRDIERRVQAEQRLVDRARVALLNQAKSRSSWADQEPTKPAAPEAEAPATPRPPHNLNPAPQ